MSHLFSEFKHKSLDHAYIWEISMVLKGKENKLTKVQTISIDLPQVGFRLKLHSSQDHCFTIGYLIIFIDPGWYEFINQKPMEDFNQERDMNLTSHNSNVEKI